MTIFLYGFYIKNYIFYINFLCIYIEIILYILYTNYFIYIYIHTHINYFFYCSYQS